MLNCYSMAKKKQGQKSSLYILPELMNFVQCSALISVVNKENEKAKEIFDEVIECCQLPGIQMLQEETVIWYQGGNDYTPFSSEFSVTP